MMQIRFEKIAAAQLKLAQTRKLSSEADLKDLEFVDKEQSGGELGKHSREMEKRDHQRLSDMDKLAFQQMHGDKNLGV